ncbi:hypothetical protein MM326_15125 [Alkalihalobacillus sp. LMS6]|uniref:BRO-N domain-containing protein n=1 Tax=Alkalihalobacillus sp. LMS6 TaxID=2924034 RepID=UPI0020D0FB6E|nr:BRO family protein [Alkalihalobacillus sp. LMS6]UTR05428.1 hypothetical protein MM326_15125 [Alkalihalobacillus sp. LMS6]
MNNLIDFNGAYVDIYGSNGDQWNGVGEAWFIPKQIAQAIGANEPKKYASKIVNRNPEKFHGFQGVTKLTTPGGTQETKIISEKGLYMFLMASDLPKAITFQRKVAELLENVRSQKLTVVDDWKALSDRITAKHKIFSLSKEASSVSLMKAINHEEDETGLDLSSIKEMIQVDLYNQAEYVKPFIEEMCVVHGSGKVEAAVLLKTYKEWNENKHHPNPSNREFYKAICSNGFRKAKGKGNSLYIYGLELKRDTKILSLI